MQVSSIYSASAQARAAHVCTVIQAAIFHMPPAPSTFTFTFIRLQPQHHFSSSITSDVFSCTPTCPNLVRVGLCQLVRAPAAWLAPTHTRAFCAL
mmetsp:Transcript_34661/g.87139  ORF Transcript_34661/g.87139 Transcript_34661/m.87139 type:complete len:95 (+) Transcript_34661:175-459(+)